MAKSKPENVRSTAFPCFCGEQVEITVRVEALLAGESLSHKCRNCSVNWNIRVRAHNGKFREVRHA